MIRWTSEFASVRTSTTRSGSTDRILTSQQCVPRRRANGGHGMRICKPPTFFGKPINIWRLHLRRAVAAEVSVTQIVGEDQNDVGWGFVCKDVRSCCQQEGEGGLLNSGHVFLVRVVVRLSNP